MNNQKVVILDSRNSGTAAVLSVLIPGMGHLYCGKFLQSIFMFFVTMVGYAFFIIPGILMHLLVICDASRIPSLDAKRIMKNLKA